MNSILRTLLVFVVLTAAGFAADDFAATKKKAEAGDATAQNNLGLMYDNGNGVPKDYAEAVKWYRLAADQGLAAAQLRLGLMYDNGDGVPKDSAEAVKWYRLAADQGYATAQFALGAMYWMGKGVPEDLVQAHVWLHIAGANGNQSAKRYLISVESGMAPDQIAEAMKLARELFAKLPKKK
jgi:TPR repeat protein